MTTWRVCAAAVLAPMVLLQACGAKPEAQAAGTAQSLLAAIQAGDAKGFEALLDRPALRTDLRTQIASVARANHVLVDGGPSDFALDNRISPQAVTLVQAGSGAPLAAPPSKAQVMSLLKRVDANRVCLHDLTPQQNCLMTLAKEPAGWRLIGMLAGGVTLAVPAEVKK